MSRPRNSASSRLLAARVVRTAAAYYKTRGNGLAVRETPLDNFTTALRDLFKQFRREEEEQARIDAYNEQ